MSNLIRTAAAGLAALTLAACADAPPREADAACAAADWRAEGLAEAQDGRAAAQGLARIAACPALAAAPAREAAEDAYLSGHDEGRAAWCAPASARALGREGRPASLSCPPHMADAFARAYAEGASERAEAEARPGFRLRPLLGVTIGTRGVGLSSGIALSL